MRDQVLLLFGHLRVRDVVTVRHEARVPSKRLGHRRLHDRAAGLAAEYIHCAPFVDIRNRAHGHRGLIVEPTEHAMQTRWTDGFQEPFHVRTWNGNRTLSRRLPKNAFMRRGDRLPGSPSMALKHRLVSSTMHGPLMMSKAARAFVLHISSRSPWCSGKSTFLLDNCNKNYGRVCTRNVITERRFAIPACSNTWYLQRAAK